MTCGILSAQSCSVSRPPDEATVTEYPRNNNDLASVRMWVCAPPSSIESVRIKIERGLWGSAEFLDLQKFFSVADFFWVSRFGGKEQFI